MKLPFWPYYISLNRYNETWNLYHSFSYKLSDFSKSISKVMFHKGVILIHKSFFGVHSKFLICINTQYRTIQWLSTYSFIFISTELISDNRYSNINLLSWKLSLHEWMWDSLQILCNIFVIKKNLKMATCSGHYGKLHKTYNRDEYSHSFMHRVEIQSVQ
jgi:hypothetical protein